MRADYEQLKLDQRQWNSKLEDLVSDTASLALEIDQYKASRQAVTAEGLATSRNTRDGVWTTIKNGTLSIVRRC